MLFILQTKSTFYKLLDLAFCFKSLYTYTLDRLRLNMPSILGMVFKNYLRRLKQKTVFPVDALNSYVNIIYEYIIYVC